MGLLAKKLGSAEGFVSLQSTTGPSHQRMRKSSIAAASTFAAMLLYGCTAASNAIDLRGASASDLTDACRGKSGWRDPAPPVQIDTNVYFVGTCGITSLLVTSGAGHVLIDTAEVEAVPQILANIRRLGFKPTDIKWLLASHVHFDHVGGHAAMQAATGARIAALPDQATELERGEPMLDDPQHGVIKGITPVKVDRRLADGAFWTVGTNRFTAFATPGHTRGSTSWAVQPCATGACSRILMADSISPVSADNYRFATNPDWVNRFRIGVGRISKLPCDVLITPHPAASKLFDRLAGFEPLTEPKSCAAYSAEGLNWMERRLSTERAGL